MGKIKEIVFYNSAKTEKVFPVTESSSVYTTTTGKTVREELDGISDALNGVNIDIYSINNRVKNLEEAEVEIDLSDYYTKEEIDTKIPSLQSGNEGTEGNYIYSTGKKDGKGVITKVTGKVSQDAYSVTFKNTATYWGGGGTSTDSTTINSATDTRAGVMLASDKAKLDSIDMNSKQDNLISGENIKTINGESILGYGNITIQGGSGEGGLKIEKLTQAEYDALGEYSDDTLYAITDSQDTPTGGGGANVIELTRSEYESLTEYQPDTFYVITDEDTDILSRLASIEARLNAAGI